MRPLAKYLGLGLSSVFLLSVTSAEEAEELGISEGKAQLTMIFTTDAENEAQGDRLLASHAKFTQATDPREGDRALLLYTLTKGQDLRYTEDFDAELVQSDKIVYVLTQVYETRAGLVDNLVRIHDDWEDMDAFAAWGAGKSVTIRRDTSIVHSF